MVFLNDSLTVVLVGDWNKLYIQPDWVANNIYETEEIEIGVNGQGSDFSVSYRCDNVIISPDQGKVVLTGTPQEVFQQEKKLKEMKLDIPFSLKLADELKKRGVTVDRCITMEGMVNELCRLRSKM